MLSWLQQIVPQISIRLLYAKVAAYFASDKMVDNFCVNFWNEYHYLQYLYLDYSPDLCHFYSNVSAVVLSNLLQVYNNQSNLEGILN